MPRINDQLVEIFEDMAALLEVLQANRFKVNAFQKAARAIGEMTEDVAEQSQAQLKAIDGIGSGTAQRIREFVDTGRIEEYENLKAEVPDGVIDLLDVPGLGPKTAAVLWQQAGVTDRASLREKLEKGELDDLPRMGKKTLENLKKNLDFAESAGQRVRIGQAMPVARRLVDQLARLQHVQQAAYAGSLRRGRETIGDVDLLVAADPAKHGQTISKAFTQLDEVSQIIQQGKTKTSVRTARGLQIDLRVIEPEAYGVALMYFTGSKEHNVRLRERAIAMNMKLSEYGLFGAESEKRLAGKTEQEVYEKLNLAWVPPELREDRDEIERAENSFEGTEARRHEGTKGKKLPDLIELKHIKAELHAHTSASDGHWSIRELAEAAAERGFHTVAVTDHSRSQVQARGLTHKRLEEHIKNVRTVADEMKDRITILAGSEVDILTDGKLDYPDSLLKELDIVVASPHAALQQEPKKATSRLLKAIENRYVSILGHPTGRIVNKREGLHPDMHKIIHAAVERGIALEINANHHRLDLRDTHARAAIEAGAKLAINTDAHGPADLDELYYGLLTARRAGVTRADVINTMSKTALEKWLKATREQ